MLALMILLAMLQRPDGWPRAAPDTVRGSVSVQSEEVQMVPEAVAQLLAWWRARTGVELVCALGHVERHPRFGTFVVVDSVRRLDATPEAAYTECRGERGAVGGMTLIDPLPREGPSLLRQEKVVAALRQRPDLLFLGAVHDVAPLAKGGFAPRVFFVVRVRFSRRGGDPLITGRSEET